LFLFGLMKVIKDSVCHDNVVVVVVVVVCT